MGRINNTDYRLMESHLFPGYLKFEVVVEDGFFDIASDEDMQIVEAWCKQHGCGVRSTWDKFYFETPDQMTMFKLRWA
jgi:hypothetical protein